MTPSQVECPQCCALAKPLAIKDVHDPDGRLVAVVKVYLCDCGHVFTEVQQPELAETGRRDR